MPNEIPVLQNDPHFINLLAAFSQAYDTVGIFTRVQTILILATAVILPFVAGFFPALQIGCVIFSLAVLLIDVYFLERQVKQHQELGAKIQEMFDTELFGLPWNDIRVGEKPLPEIVAGLEASFKKKHSQNAERMQRLMDWYPKESGDLPLELGRLVCQRSSMVWDASLRKQYCACHMILISVIILVAVIYAVAMEWTLAKFLLIVLAPLAPACIKINRGFMKHQESAGASERARQSLKKTWERAMEGHASGDVLTVNARCLQDELFDRRKNSSRVPDWFYHWKRTDFQHQMEIGAQEMVKQAKENLPGQ